MRKFILITAMVLASATAHASGPRGLTLASNDEPAAVAGGSEKPAEAQPAAAQPVDAKPAEAQPAEAPKYVDRPSPVDAKAQPADQKNADAAKAAKPKHRHESTEARVIYELHRHGIYW